MELTENEEKKKSAISQGRQERKDECVRARVKLKGMT
jgi:hypothetical protein